VAEADEVRTDRGRISIPVEEFLHANDWRHDTINPCLVLGNTPGPWSDPATKVVP
jgi:hypothetical protein